MVFGCKMRQAVFLPVALLAIELLTGIAHAVTVNLTTTDPLSVVVLHVGDRLRVELPAAPATGFRWELKTVDASHLESLSKDLRPDSGHLDTAATQVFVWKAIAPGSAELAISYRRPSDERSMPPAKNIAITVDVLDGVLGPPPTSNADLLASELKPVATYRGNLPCSDCLQAVVEITLYASAGAPGASNQSTTAPTAFLQSTRYMGTAEGSRTQIVTGQLKVVHGSYADPSATIYVLDGPAVGTFQVDADHLTSLDAQMLPAKSPQGAPILLEKLPQSASEP